MEIFQLLDKSNFRECNEATCLAFAAAMYQGKRQIGECPLFDQAVAEQYGGKRNTATTIEQDIGKSANADFLDYTGTIMLLLCPDGRQPS